MMHDRVPASDPSLLSVQVGLPRQLGTSGASDAMDRPWRTAFIKGPVEGPVRLRSTGLDGDAQADRRGHGGAEMAVLAYSADHYPLWRSELGLAELGPGGFAENFTVAGLSEQSVCVGDIYAVGSARVQVSQPRAPCASISRRWRRKELLERVLRSGRTGWFLRVLAEGTVERNLPVVLLDRPFPRWTVACVHQLRYGMREDAEAVAALAACPLLSPDWRMRFSLRSARATRRGTQARAAPQDGS